MAISLSGIMYSIMAGLTVACFYMLSKKTTSTGRQSVVVFWVFLAHLPFFMLWVAMTSPHHIAPAYFLPGCAEIGLTLAGNLLTRHALTHSPFSMMIPVLGLSPVFASLTGIPLLNEWPSMQQWLGIALSVLGVLWLYAPPEKPWDIFSFWSRLLHDRGAPSIILAALTWALCAPMDRLALRYADPAFHALFVFTGFVVALLIILFARGEGVSTLSARHNWWLLAITGGVGALAGFTQLHALQHTPAGAFEAIKRVMSQLLALFFGAFLFHEKITKPKLIGIGILSIGVPLIVL